MAEANITLEALAENVDRLLERVQVLERQARPVDVQAEYEKMLANNPHLDRRHR